MISDVVLPEPAPATMLKLVGGCASRQAAQINVGLRIGLLHAAIHPPLAPSTFGLYSRDRPVPRSQMSPSLI